MTDGPAPPVLDDPMLEALTFDQLAQLVNEVSPEAFYLRAAAFDQAAARLQDVLDQIRHQLNIVQDSWTGKVSDEFDSLARGVSGQTTVVLQFLQNPGYGSILREAGDLLAAHQRRLRDLQGQKAQQESAPPVAGGPPPEEVAEVNGQSAKQILRDLRAAYQVIANAMTPLPFEAPTVVDKPSSGKPHSTGPLAEQHAPQMVTRTVEDPGGAPDVPVDDTQLRMAMAVAAPMAPLSGGRQGTGGPPGAEVRSHHVLGRGEPESHSTGRGEIHPDLLAGGSIESGHHQAKVTPAVLGHGQPAAMPLSHVDETAVAGVAVVPAVLGRADSGPATGKAVQPLKVTKTPATKGTRTVGKPVEEKIQREPGQHPDTVPVAPLAAGVHSADAIVVKTSADVPVATGGNSQGEPMVAVAGQSSPAEPPVDPDKVTPKRSFAMTAGSGGVPAVGGAVQQSAALQMNPADRGMFVPGAELLPGDVQPPAEPATRGHSARAGDPNAQLSGYPMSPMMLGGMGGGQMSQQNSRVAAVPSEPRPEVWDSSNAGPGALGRREPEPERHQAGMSKVEVEAQLAEKLAELDRLIERGK
ncbi:hypothetical protein [Kibdelosporangium phytohabitans]|uniref:WXG100 family type VII secretion target n=1 Tax=Kibdelosporangium phytohabitans TaxID=860235 RepID=A0A0N9I394_9PSEU|nr:hypothetical protein [Kibdelosporangium phytohabitans]ALG10357.1 hypothetical protein AOZ06_28775 [Kibdelosporangium phytohabitans]MBE1461404.1 uncharacterized protein YukE [Kibdelosporangium phytohabitans]